jgi:hypothetical protein
MLTSKSQRCCLAVRRRHLLGGSHHAGPGNLPNDADFVWEEAELERLRMSLGFNSMAELVAFIAEAFVLSAFAEFTDDFLYGSGGFDVPSLDHITRAMTADSHSGTRIYTSANPDKSTWGVVDHFSRFIQQVYNEAQAADSSWGGVTEPDFVIIAWQLFELLVFLARRWLANYQ